MSTQEIPRDQWKNFLDRFSRQHEGWLATLEVLGADIGAQQEARNLPLEGISATSTDDESRAIAISLGGSGRSIRDRVGGRGKNAAPFSLPDAGRHG